MIYTHTRAHISSVSATNHSYNTVYGRNTNINNSISCRPRKAVSGYVILTLVLPACAMFENPEPEMFQLSRGYQSLSGRDVSTACSAPYALQHK